MAGERGVGSEVGWWVCGGRGEGEGTAGAPRWHAGEDAVHIIIYYIPSWCLGFSRRLARIRKGIVTVIKEGLRDRISPGCTLSQNGYGDCTTVRGLSKVFKSMSWSNSERARVRA